MATNQFYQFDTGQQNMLDTYDYSSSATRTVGVGRGLASSMLHNKIFFQVSTITSALAEAMKNKGYDMLDPDATNCWSTIVAQFANIMTQADMGSYATQSWVQTYVDGLLRPLATGYVKYSEMVAYVAENAPSGVGGITLANVREALNIAFSTADGQVTGGGTTLTFTHYRATRSELDDGTNATNFVTPAIIKNSTRVPHLQPILDNVIAGDGTRWVAKTLTALGAVTASALDAYAKKADVYTKTELDGGQLNDLYFTEGELLAATSPLDAKYYTQTAADSRFLKPSDITSSKSDSGFIRIPSGSASSGIQICWGSFNLPSVVGVQTGTVPFASNFVACFSVTLSGAVLGVADEENSRWLGIVVTSKGTSSFSWQAKDRGLNSIPYTTVYYMAIGSY